MADLVEQLLRLSELHAQGTLSDSEFQAAKARLLGHSGGSQVEVPNSVLALQNELADLDRRWMMAQDKLKLRTRSGLMVPGPHEGANFTLGVSGSGVFATVAFLLIGAKVGLDKAPLVFWLFPLFGVWMVVVGVTSGQAMTQKADDYERAEAKYQNERAELEARVRALS